MEREGADGVRFIVLDHEEYIERNATMRRLAAFLRTACDAATHKHTQTHRARTRTRRHTHTHTDTHTGHTLVTIHNLKQTLSPR